MTVPDIILNASTNWCLSGGAQGADLLWGMTAGRLGHKVVHWSFAGHRSEAPLSEIVILPEKLLVEATIPCRGAAQALHRPFPLRTQFSTNMIRRNWFQVATASACYAVSSLDSRGIVKGGTAWAIAMFLQRFLYRACPAYLFDQPRAQWLEWTGVWTPIEMPPVPSGIWAGIGSRDLSEQGRGAIKTLMGYSAVSNTAPVQPSPDIFDSENPD